MTATAWIAVAAIIVTIAALIKKWDLPAYLWVDK